MNKKIKCILKMRLFVILTFSFLFFSCQPKKESITNRVDTSTIKYAKGFEIIDNDGYKTLIIKTAYQNSTETFEYTIVNKNSDADLENLKGTKIETPINKIVVTSTTHIPMMELLNEEQTIVGFPFSRYVSSEKTRALIDNGSITEIGNQNDLNTEILLELSPELVVGYAVSSTSKTYNTIEKSGIPVIYNGDWLEESPLGKAAWIKFFGLLYNKEKEADSIFKSIEKNYLEAKALALNSNEKPTVLSGAVMSKDIWNLPAGDSFVATFLKDANTNYLWSETSGKGSLALSFESVFDKAQNAKLWLAPGYFNSKEQMLQSNTLYQKFGAFENDNIFSPTLKKGKTGGVIYYELATTRPDLVLKDIVKIAHPELLKEYELSFFDKMK